MGKLRVGKSIRASRFGRHRIGGVGPRRISISRSGVPGGRDLCPGSLGRDGAGSGLEGASLGGDGGGLGASGGSILGGPGGLSALTSASACPPPRRGDAPPGVAAVGAPADGAVPLRGLLPRRPRGRGALLAERPLPGPVARLPRPEGPAHRGGVGHLGPSPPHLPFPRRSAGHGYRLRRRGGGASRAASLARDGQVL